jgi:ribosomal protein S3
LGFETGWLGVEVRISGNQWRKENLKIERKNEKSKKNDREKKCVNKEPKRENMAVGLDFRI